MRPRTAALAPLLAVLLALHGLAATAWADSDVRFGQPVASGDFGEVVTFGTTFRSSSEPLRVELLTRLTDDDAEVVESVAFERVAEDTWQATAWRAGHTVPNTEWQYRFRVVTSEGSAEGPPGSHRVRDTRVEWRVLEGDGVNVWWHEGGEDFGRRALAIAEDALAGSAELLGVGAMEPIDFFIYADTREFRDAMGPATRENVGGQANLAIRTLFGLIGPRQVDSGWVEELIRHELAHLVFHEAADNPYQYPPRWLNEGLAVYLAKGFTEEDRAQVRGAAGGGTIMPLEALGGNFPTRAIRSSLAYAESVAAVDFFIRTHGQDRLVELITSFADGRGLDEAFRGATGEDFAAFDEAWLASLGAGPPETYGPRTDEPGAVPAEWAEEAAAEAGALLG